MLSFKREKWRVLTPTVELSNPLLEAGRSSARRKPGWEYVGEGAKMEASLMVTSRGLVFFLRSNFDGGCQRRNLYVEVYGTYK